MKATPLHLRVKQLERRRLEPSVDQPGEGTAKPDGKQSPKDAPGVTKADIQPLRDRLAAGDRAGMYLSLYEKTGNDLYLMHAQITTFSGVYGGAAVTGNYLAKTSNKGTYQDSLDVFSREIASSIIDTVENDVRAGGDGKVANKEVRQGDWRVWDGKGMGTSFPGNVLFACRASPTTRSTTRRSPRPTSPSPPACTATRSTVSGSARTTTSRSPTPR